MSYELIDALSLPVHGQFSTVNAINLAGIGASKPGLIPGWWIVYNGHLAPAGTGDVELDFVNATSSPEPATDILIGGAMLGLALLGNRARAALNETRGRAQAPPTFLFPSEISRLPNPLRSSNRLTSRYNRKIHAGRSID